LRKGEPSVNLFRSGKATWLILIAGAVISAFAHLAVLEVGTSRKIADFEQKAGDRLAAVQRRITVELSIVSTIVANFSIRPDTSRRDFDRLVGLAARDATEGAHQALEWIPRVAHRDRARFEAAARAEGFAEFAFRERGDDGKMAPASQRAEYFPVYYVHPFAPNKGAFGFDLGSNPIRLAALQRARDSGKTIASAKINLVQVSRDAAGILIFAPVYRGQIEPSSVAERRARLVGFGLGVFRVGGLISAPITSAKAGAVFAKPAGIDLFLYDTSATGDDAPLYIHHSRTRADPAPTLSHAMAITGLHHEIRMDVGGRTWSVVARAVNPDVAALWKWIAWAAVLAVMTISLLASVYLSTIAGRGRAVRTLVDQRTAELRQATDLARDNEARVRAIVDTVVDGIITIDENGTMESANPAAQRIFGYDEEELIGQNVRLLMPQPYHDEHDGYLKRYHDTGEARIIGLGREVVGLRKDGSTFPLELGVSEMQVDQSRMFTGIVRDISKQKLAETMKTEFVSTVSHELRTPLTSIKGSLGLIRSGVVGELPEKLTAMLDIAYNNSERLVLLINDILDIEKIEAGKMDFRRESVDLSDLIRRAVDDNQGFAETHGVTYRVIENLPQAWVTGDGDRLMQVMANLLSNAAKFSVAGSEIDVFLTRRDAVYRVSVLDRGAGIPDDYKARIFERFSQGDSSDTRQKGGTGLGLSICKAIIEHQDGVLDFVSAVGRGSTFYFELPVQNDQVISSAENDQAPLATGHRPRVLHVEDQSDVTSVLRAVAKDFCDIDATKTVAGAKALLAESAYDLVILDLILPDGDGEELLPYLHSPDGIAIPAIIFSVKEVDADLAQAVEAVLTKSQTSNEELLAAVKAAVQSSGRGRKSAGRE